MNPQSGYQMSYGISFISAIISLTLTTWFVIFTILVVSKLGKIIKLLSNK